MGLQGLFDSKSGSKAHCGLRQKRSACSRVGCAIVWCGCGGRCRAAAGLGAFVLLLEGLELVPGLAGVAGASRCPTPGPLQTLQALLIVDGTRIWVRQHICSAASEHRDAAALIPTLLVACQDGTCTGLREHSNQVDDELVHAKALHALLKSLKEPNMSEATLL